MDLWLFIFSSMISIITTSANHDTTADDYYDYTAEDFRETRPPARTNLKNNRPTNSPLLALYEVTELVEDIPSPNPISVPLVTNFTVNKPLNIVSNATDNPRPNNNVLRQNPKFRREFTTASNNNNAGRNDFTRNPFDNTNVDTSYDDEDDDDELDEEIHEDYHLSDIIPTLKAYLAGLQKGIVNGLNGLVGKDVFKAAYVNDPTTNPVWFLNKLKQNKGHSHENLYSPFDYEIEGFKAN